VSAAGNIQFIIRAFTQVLGVGSMALIAQAVGRRDLDDATLVFNQNTTRALICAGLTLLVLPTLLWQWKPALLVQAFASDPAVVAVGADYLRKISWNFVASGLIFTCSGMFQALGNTVPSLVSSASRLLTFGLLAIWLATRPGFSLHQLWIVSVATTLLQAVFSVWLLRTQLERRLVSLHRSTHTEQAAARV